jgi:hypothetical protein
MYNSSPQAGLAALTASPYADSDVMNVRMTPREVAGLQQLAMSYGADEQDLYDPVTGQPRFSFLKKILPMIAGTVLGPAGFGMSAFGAAATVGAVTGLIEGDLKKGLMAGLGAYSGAKIGEGLKAAATPAPAPTAPATEVAPAPNITAGSATQFPKVTGYGADQLSRMTDYQDTYVPPAPVTQTVQAATTVKPPPTGFFDTMGQGVKNVFSAGDAGTASRQAFMGVFDNPLSKYATLAGGLAAITPDQKPLVVPEQENIMYIPGGFNPQYGTGAGQPYMLPGQYYKRTAKGLVPYNPYQKAPGYATGGPVQPADQNLNQQRALPHQYQPIPNPNQNYPLSTVVQANYQPNAPQQREVISGYEAKIDPYTGEEKFAEGGTTTTTTQQTTPSLVEANRKYVEELNRRAMNPTFTPYGMIVAGSGGLGGTNQPWTGTNPYGGPLNTTTGGQQTTGGGTDPVTGILAAYGAQQGFNALMGSAAGKAALAKLGLGSKVAAGGATAGGATAGTTTVGTTTAGATTAGATGATTGTSAAGAGAGGGGSSAGAGASALKGGATPLGTAAAAAAALIGAHQAYQGISKGKEGQAAAGGALAGAGGAYLAGATGLGSASLTGLGAFGPIGLAGAAIAAIGASLVNTKEFGDVALRNYWNAVDAGRGIGQTDANELAQGFINFYRTNKNEFAGQAKYGRTGNEDFLYDMTQVINNAVKDGKVNKDVDAATMYKSVVQPWLNSMGEGPKDDKARAIQDFMMTDLINSFMQGKNISNSQVKNDKKYKLVSERPVYAGATPTPQKTPAAQDETVRRAIETYGGVNPFGQGRDMSMPYGPTTPFADGGAIGEDYNFGFAGGGMSEYKAGGKLLNGPGDGMSDSIPAVIRGKGVQRAALADGEFVVPADVVSHLGNGSTKAGAKKLYAMMDRVRQARTGRTRQAPAVKTDRLLPA